MLDTPERSNSREARGDDVIHPLTKLETHMEKGAMVIEGGGGVWVIDNRGD
jgi:adenosylmethionine-8-amino-7-oxononanoate aminotransferase